jgi:hypothetical protein
MISVKKFYTWQVLNKCISPDISSEKVTVCEHLEEKEMTYKIWFRDGSKVPTKGGVDNEIDTDEELREMAARYDFDADEVLQNGETEMVDNDQAIGGVFKL